MTAVLKGLIETETTRTDAAGKKQRYRPAVVRNGWLPTAEAHESTAAALTALRDALGKPNYRRVVDSSLRVALLVQAQKKGEKAPHLRARWTLPVADPRWASFDSCSVILEEVLAMLVGALADADQLAALTRALANPISWGLPLDHKAPGDHKPNGFKWVWTAASPAVLAREFFLGPHETVGDEAEVFKRLYNKVILLAHRTGRALTGDFPTNRELRWEARPDGPQFGSHEACLRLESKLILQVALFEGFPEEPREALAAMDLIDVGRVPLRCPITMQPMNYQEFRQELLERESGRSNYQLGHIHPLAAEGGAGHSAANATWILADGNRMQGHLTVEATRKLIRETAERYDEHGLGDDDIEAWT